MTKKDKNWLSGIFDKVLKAPAPEAGARAEPAALAPAVAVNDDHAKARDPLPAAAAVAATAEMVAEAPRAEPLYEETAAPDPETEVREFAGTTAPHDAHAEPAEPETAAVPSALDDLIAELHKDAAWVHVFAEDSAPLAETGLFAHALERAGEAFVVRLSGGDPAAFSNGLTGGYGLRLPDELEAAASGRLITIKVVARGAEAAEARFACAYTTNEVGNSGWLWRTAGPEWALYDFAYRVPTMVDGQGDFLGLLPAPHSEPAIEIAGLAIAIGS